MSRFIRLYNNAAFVPLLSTQVGRNTMLSTKGDSNYVTTNVYGGYSADRDVGIPMVSYFHNFLPVAHGMKSVGWNPPKSKPNYHTNTRVVQLRTCEDTWHHVSLSAGGNSALLQRTSHPEHSYSYEVPPCEWKSIGGALSDTNYTVAHLHKTSYVMREYETLEYYASDYTLKPVSLKGVDITKIKGVTHANNYLVLYTADTIHHSSALDSADFLPQLSTLAGSIMPLHLRGAIVLCLPTANGFMIFTELNAVRATYTNSPTEPFKFSEVYGSGGIRDWRDVTCYDNADSFYVISTKGLQVIPKDNGNAEHIFPEVSDFISGYVYEEYIGETYATSTGNSKLPGVWDSTTQSYEYVAYNRLRQTRLTAQMKTQITIVSDRFLCISYAPKDSINFEYCIVHDLTMKRWGKLRKIHSTLFDFLHNGISHDISVIDYAGVVTTSNFEVANTCQDSVLIYDKMAYDRAKVSTVQSIEIENTHPEMTSLLVFTALDGKNGGAGIAPVRQRNNINHSKWILRTTGLSHGLLITGYLEFVSITIETTGGGRK